MVILFEGLSTRDEGLQAGGADSVKIEPHEIPESWVFTTMGEISTVIGGGTPKTKEPDNYEGGNISWLTPADLSVYTGKKIGHGSRFITEKGFLTSSARMMPAGTVLYTSRAPIGYVAIASNPICTNQGFKSFVLHDGILPDYIYWYLKGTKDLAESLASGTTFLELSGARAKQIPIPIAPLNEQKRIVAEIEKQFSRLDEAVANLKRVKANLKRYKASVLKAAVEGKLTEEWRDKNKADIISENIFDIVSGKRISNYNELCKHAKKTGKPKPKKPSNIDTKFSVDEEVLNTMASIPKEWQYVHIAFITNDKPDSVVDGPFGSSVNVKKDYIESGIPVIRIHNIVPFQFINDNLKYLRKEKFGKLRRHNILAGDILFGKVGTIGNSCIYPNNMQEGMLSTTGSCRIRVDEGLYHKNFLCLVLNAYKPIFNRIASSAVQAFLNMQTIKKFPIPLLSLNEQEAIMKQVDVLLSVAERIEIQVDKGVTRAERLRQSILAQAFSGLLIQSKES